MDKIKGERATPGAPHLIKRARWCSIVGMVFVILCCVGCKSAEKSLAHPQGDTSAATASFPISGITELFLKQFRAVTPPADPADEEKAYAALIRQFNLKRLNDGQYALCGFIRFNDEFDPLLLRKRGIVVNPPVEDRCTVCVPLREIEFFFSSKGILSFENSMQLPPL